VAREVTLKAVQLVPVPSQRLFGVKAAATYLGVSTDTLRTYADQGKIRARRLNRRRVFTLEVLDDFIDSLPEYRTYE
jgi:excisionase family DNA binding protein